VGDIDGDGKLEIVFYDWRIPAWAGLREAFWCVRDEGSICNPYASEWPMFRGNPSRTGTRKTLPITAVELAKAVIGAPYLGDGNFWGGKGKVCGEHRFVAPKEITTTGYIYWHNHPCVSRCTSKCYVDECCARDTVRTCVKGKCEIAEIGAKGLDCSGLIFWSYNRAYFGNRTLTADEYETRPLYYEGANSQFRANCVEIRKEDLRPGDLLFYSGKKDKMTHVMMYTGLFIYQGKEYNVIHASYFTGEVSPAVYDFTTEVVTTVHPTTGKKQSLKVTAYGRVSDPKLSIQFISYSPVDLIVTDPDGEQLTREMRESLSMALYEL
jgi:cell wall-associated NlpC family hydrolase